MSLAGYSPQGHKQLGMTEATEPACKLTVTPSGIYTKNKKITKVPVIILLEKMCLLLIWNFCVITTGQSKWLIIKYSSNIPHIIEKWDLGETWGENLLT